MAELTPELIEKLTEAINNAADRIGSSSKKINDELFKTASVAKEERAKRLAESGQLRKTYEDLQRLYKEEKISREEYLNEMKELGDQTRFLGDEYSDLKKEVKDTTSGFKSLYVNTDTLVNKVLPAFGNSMLKAADLGMGLAKAFQGGGAGFEAASSLIQAGISGAGGAMQGAGSLVKDFGSNISITNKKTGALNFGLQGLGMALSGVGKTAPLFNAGVDMMVKQISVITEGYSKSSTAGAIFADSFQGFANNAKQAGLTVEQFGRFLTNNNQILFTTGLGITDAAKRVGSVGEAARKSGITERLQKLGFGFEEQAEVTARVIADMQRAGTLAAASDSDIAQATEKYATNLRVIAAITGEDAKKRQDEARQQMNNLAVQAKIQEMRARGDIAGADRMQNILSTVPAGLKNMTAELLATGGNLLTRESGKVFAAMGPAGEQFKQNIMSLAQNTAMSGDDVTKAMATVRDDLRSAIEGNLDQLRTLGLAALQGNANIGQLGEVIGSIFADVRGNTADTARLAEENAEKAKNATNKLTENFVGAQTAAQNLAIGIDQIVNDALPSFAGALKTILEGAKSVVDALNGGQSSFLEKMLAGAASFITILTGGASIIGAFKGRAGGGTPPAGGGGARPTSVPQFPRGGGGAAAGVAAKGLGKGAAKMIPGVGLALSAVEAAAKIKQGDYVGAALEGASGLASLIPGFGTAASAALSGLSMARDSGLLSDNTTGITPIQPQNLPSAADISDTIGTASATGTTLNELATRMNAPVTSEDLLKGIEKMSTVMQDLLKATNDVVSNTAKTARGVA